MYGELADWWPVLSAPDDYAEEAGIFIDAITSNARRGVKRVLELGSGGGNNASHMKSAFDMTLVELSPQMIAVSEALNPDLAHHHGDMRTFRIDDRFDAVFIHDAINYMLTEADVAAAIATAAEHLEVGGVALFVPDDVSELYVPETSSGGHDAADRSMRYLEWSHEPHGTTVDVTYVFVLRDADGIRVEHETHPQGLFPRGTWLGLIEQAGLEAGTIPYEHSEFDKAHEFFYGIKP